LPEEYNKYFEEAAETYNKIYDIQKDLSNLSKNLEALAGQLNYILAFRL
jgi:hypothetical protein